MANKQPQTAKQFVQKFAEFLAFLEKIAPRDLDQEMQDLGYDPREVGAKGLKLARSILDKQLQEERQSLRNARIDAHSKIEMEEIK